MTAREHLPNRRASTTRTDQLDDLRRRRDQAAARIDELTDELERHARPALRDRIGALAALIDHIDRRLAELST
jgi:hypothetical protein